MAAFSILESVSTAFHSLQFHPYRRLYPHYDVPLHGISLPSFTPIALDLSQRVAALRDEQQKSTHCRLDWFTKAVSLLLFAHSSVQLLIPHINFHSLSQREHKSVEENMQDDVKLLDACNAIKEAIVEKEHSLMLVKMALHSLQTMDGINLAKLVRARKALFQFIKKRKMESSCRSEGDGQKRSNLEACCSMLRRMSEKSSSSSSPSPLVEGMQAAKYASSMILSALSAALNASQGKLLASVSNTSNAGASSSLWYPCFTRLQHLIRDDMEKRRRKGCDSVVQELHNIDDNVQQLHTLIHRMLASSSPALDVMKAELRESIGILSQSSLEMERGIQNLRTKMNEMYGMLVSIRLAIMNAGLRH